MRSLTSAVCLVTFSLVLLAQSDRGTITGTVADPTGAVVANAPIEAKNVETGAVYQAGTSATGNYTLTQLPTGTYEVSVTVPGFKKFIRANLLLPVAQTLRIDVTLEVGSSTESVTVREASSLLKTESGELSHNVATEAMNNLPVLGIGTSAAGQAGIRNPYAVLQVLPGSDYRPDSSLRLNGMPSNTQSLQVEGQDASNSIYVQQSETQPSVEAIQEFAIDTSNYAAEFGQAGGGVFNVTMRSGTNQPHGSAYEYFVNDALNAGQPFTSDGKGHLLRPRQRRNDYGFSLGGPVYIPKLYNGHDKAFFFFNFEQFRETVINNAVPITVPTLAYRNGNFSQALTGRSLGTDPLGRTILENTIYDPSTNRVVNGLIERDPFPNNTIPSTDIDPVAAKIQAMIPQPTASGLINNYLTGYGNPRLSSIPSVKIDELLGPKSKLSGYWSRTGTSTPNNSALPFPLSSGVPQYIVAHTVRLNFDQTLTPTLLLHLGVGLVDTLLQQATPSYDPAGIGLKGTYSDLFPALSGLTAAQGGMANMGPGTQIRLVNTKPTANTSLTWVRNNHTYKAGGGMIIEGLVGANKTYTNGTLAFNAVESGLPSLNGVSLPGGTVGFPYASFLLGAVDSGAIGVPSKTRVGSHAFSWFVQDSWKVTRKFTLDYGLRYDFQSYLREQPGVTPEFSASTPNPSAGGRLGAVVFDGYGPGRCNCSIAHNYPFAYGPRLGAAYQITPKTVLRVGAGISYYKTTDSGLISYSLGSENQYSSPSYGAPAYLMQNGLPYQVTWPNFDPGQFPLPGTTSAPAQQIDPNAGRPARTVQWSFGLQRQLAKSLVVEATYVGNRGVWWDSYYLIAPNALTIQTLAAAGLSLNSPADLQLLAAPLNSSIAAQRGFSNLPYPGFPLTATVGQTLRPFPQFGNLTNMHFAPDGDTWYNALQTKATQRFSHGLDASASFTWSKQQMMGSEEGVSQAGPISPATNDVFNRPQNKYLSGFDQPFLLVISGSYTTPKLTGANKFTGNKGLSWMVRDWQIGTLLRYGSGLPIQSPTATNGLSGLLFRGEGPGAASGGTFMDRVPGVPLLTQNLNCHCFDPNKTFVLNPAAWVNPPAGQWGTAAAYYSNYRYQRRPVENLSLGRVFRIKERANFQIRAEFTNIFNRTEVNNPTATNALATQTGTAAGQTTAGFGFINNGTTFSAPRQGTLVARFQF